VSLKKLGRYDLVRVLGKGAMGVVYEGRDPNLDRRVAIKTVKVENLSEEAAAEYEARFRTEARSAARLQHPNIVSVYDSDRDGDIAFLVMEYIQGDDLKHHLDKGVLYSLEQSLKMIRDLLSALDYAHKQGIVHRDIKPANMLIEPGGRVKLTDFGVARIQDSGEATRTQGSMIGTLKYMSPEQVQGQKTDARADLFSVGVVLYQLLTDKRPFDGDNDFSIIHQIIGHTPPPPSSFNARLPSAIDAVVARALAKDREQRFATARDFALALQSAIRRAEDATVVPPADTLKKPEGAGTGSKGQISATGTAGTAPTSGSTVTQEIELVYWKDIRDSADAEELEGFLAKFPSGIYADLARRRLRKLMSGTSSPDPELGSAFAAATAQDLEATCMLSGTSPSLGAAYAEGAATPAAIPEPASPTTGRAAPDFTRTIAEPHEPAQSVSLEVNARRHPIPAAGAAAAAAADAASVAAPGNGTAPPGAGRKRSLVAVLSSLGVLVAVGMAAMMMMEKNGGDTSGSAGAGNASPDASGVVVAGSMVPTANRSSAPEAAASGAGKAAPPSTAASRSAPAARPAASAAKSNAASAAVAESVPEPPPPPREEPQPRRVSAPAAPAAPSPVEVCRDKVFLAREFCLAEKCEKPGTRHHPLCVKRREDAKLREESKVRN
jgi:eukaryotic-like serine/threonine-protein kinase